MSRVVLSAGRQEDLRERMRQLGIDEADLRESFILGSGPGGQKVNKSSTCVSLAYAPAGIHIKCQRTRSLALNRYYARRELCERMAERIEGERSERQRAAEKIRRQKRRRSRRQQERRLAEKRITSEKKALRRRVEHG